MKHYLSRKSHQVQKMESGKDLLSNVFGILNELEVFDASSKDAGGSIIKFKYPRELMVRLIINNPIKIT